MCHKNEITSQRWTYISIILLVVATVSLFGRSIGFDFINYDDPAYVYNNEFVTQGVTAHGLRWAMTGIGETNLWHPLTWISHMIDVEVFGVKNAGAHHGVNVFWHILGALGLFFLLRRITGNVGVALFLTMLWALHPQRVQSVVWISERKDLLSGAFFLWSWYCWEKWRDVKCQNKLWYGLALALFVMAAMAKPSVIPLPVILWLREMLRGDQRFSFKRGVKWAMYLTPFFMISLLVAGVTIYFQRQGAMAGVSDMMPLPRRVMLMPVSLWWYVKGFLWSEPGQLWVYPPAGHLRDWVIPGIGLFLTFAGIKIMGARTRTVWLGAGVMVALWLPVSGIVPVSFYYVADRYSYLIHLGLLIILSGVLQMALLWLKDVKRPQVLVMLAGVMIVLVATVSFGRMNHWKNSETLFSHERVINPRSLLAPIHLGIVRHEQGRYEEALALFQEALKIDENSGMAANRSGMVLERLGRKAEAENMYQAATEKKVLNSDAPFNHWARLRVERGDVKGGELALLDGLRRFPDGVALQIGLGAIALSHQGNAAKALKWYSLALEITPYDPEAMQGKGVALITLGHNEEGRKVLRELLARYPERVAVAEFLRKNP